MRFRPSRTFLLVAAHVFILMAAPALAQTPLVDECAALLPEDRPMPSGADAPAIAIAAPLDGDVIYGTTATITVETTNFDLNTDARHWHLWVDGVLMGMVYQENAIIELAPGSHTICASMGNTDHADLGMPAGLRLTVNEAAAGTPTTVVSIAPEAGRVLPEEAITPGQVMLVIAIGLLAAVGGWWLGSRIPKRNK